MAEPLPSPLPSSPSSPSQLHSKFSIKEDDVIRLMLEFHYNRDLSISQLSIERETGVYNGTYSDDLLFLRQLILDGQWDDALQFVQPLENIDNFDSKQFHYLIVKYKYIELLCIRSEAGPYQNVEVAVSEVVTCLNQLEQYCASKEEYNELCLLLTLPSLGEHNDYKHWNPSKWRVKCFNAVLPLIEKYLQTDKRTNDIPKTSKGDRLLQLIIKGILYESCVSYCQRRATAAVENETAEMSYSSLLEGTGFSNADLSLLSWLQSIPQETFAYPFEQKTLNVDIEQLEKPSLVASWSELILVTPIKPKVFPHSATPFSRVRASDLMSKSLTPGLVDGLSKSIMAFSVNDVAAMSRSSFATTGFHLNASPDTNKKMQTSVDRLFEDGDVFSSSCFETLPTIPEKSYPIATHSNSIKPMKTENCDQLNSNTPQSVKVKGQEITPDLWQKFQREKQKLLEKLMMENETISVNEKNNIQTPLVVASNSINSENLTPQNQMGQSNFPNPETLTTSTPKGNYFRCKENANFSPNQSPIFSTAHNGSTVSPFIQKKAFNEKLNATPIGKLQISPDVSDLNVTPKHNGPNASMRSNVSGSSEMNGKRPQFVAVTTLEDAQAIRAAEFHPNGQIYAIGSNSKTLRICGYPKSHELRMLREDHEPHQPNVVSKRLKHHKGSIYCLSWNITGDLLATGSNDKTIKLMRFNPQTCDIEGGEAELTMHDGTVRDLCFMEDLSNRSSLLISGGAGDCKIYITDCDTATPFQALSGHSGHILSLYTWGGAMFVSGSQDRTIRFWDLRTRGCVNLITAPSVTGSGPGSPVASVCVDPSGKLLVSGHEDANCMLYDIRGGRIIQTFRPHTGDIRTIRFSPKAYYLLSGGYDNKIVLTDLQGDLTQPLASVVVAEHTDKVIQGRWHPNDFSFLTTSADKTATLWALPNN